MTASAIYEGPVTHLRVRPKRHALKYRVFQLLLDLDELPSLSARSRLFGHNRAALLAFNDRDHLDGSATPLRAQIEVKLARAGVCIAGGPIRVLCMPRVLGRVFNPISVWFCHHRGGDIAAIIYEVNNTFGERHSYVLPARAEPVLHQTAPKRMHVSPFMDMGLTYDFAIQPPGERVSIGIHVKDAGGLWLTAGFSGDRREFTDAELFKAWARHPLLTLAVVGGIHWEALKIWLKGVKYRRKPAAAEDAVTVQS
ncbi:MAG: DUF1365 domain-containing protein [Caulobacteraceae bacterium]